MSSAVESNSATIAFTDAWVLNETTGRVRKRSAMAYQDPPQPLPDMDTFLLELLQRNFIYNSVTVRREALVAVGGYDERLRIGEDWELWLRLAAAGFRFVRVPEWLAVYRKHADSLTSDSERLLAAANEVYRIVIEEWSASDELRDLALRLRDARELRVRRRAKAAALLGPLVALRRRLRESTGWHREPPREIADLLLAVAATRPG